MAPSIKNVYRLGFNNKSGEGVTIELNVLAFDIDEAIKKGREVCSKNYGGGDLEKVEFICQVDVE